ncbi:hypothetical protein PXH80_33615, partial [Mycolicibacterium smegmatis]|nr:hypothetical protein [Mycolicibacterium smegmatis]
KLLSLTAPGVPDVYQGTELAEDSLVDPDNRRPIDYAAHRAALRVLDAEPQRARAVEYRAAELATIAGVTEAPVSAVVSVILGDPEIAVGAAAACLDRGV